MDTSVAVDCYTRPTQLTAQPILPTESIRERDSSPRSTRRLLARRQRQDPFLGQLLTLIAAGIGFSVRGVRSSKDWGNQFGFTQSELGTITGGGLVGFGLAIIFFSFFADRFGYGKLMLVAFLLHASSAVVTFAATPVYAAATARKGAFWCLNLGMWLFALGNGTCEAVINPLTATLFPRNKTHWLNILHAGWPLGLILGAGIMLGFNQLGRTIRWECKLGVFLIPVLVYGLLMFNRPFPQSEAKTAGVPLDGDDEDRRHARLHARRGPDRHGAGQLCRRSSGR